MKIYVIKIEEVYDMESYDHDVEAYKKREDAKKRFDEIVDKAKKEYPDYWEREESETAYSTWKDGEYCDTHYSVSMKETELR